MVKSAKNKYNGYPPFMSFIRLDSHAFAHNIATVQALVPTEKIAIVLKDNAYGHGLAEMASLAVQNGIRHAVVRTVAEAESISGSFETVLILAEIPREKPADCIEVAVNSLEEIAKVPEGTAIHLKVDPGMHRNGIEPSELETALQKIKNSGLRLTGLFSHSRSGDELSSELFWQYKNFLEIKARCETLCTELGMALPLFHFANSPTLLRFGETVAFDRVRIGIAAYGYIDAEPLMRNPDLRPVLSLWGERIVSRKLRKGQRVGYGGAGMMSRDGVVGTYDLGYADGLFRHDGSVPFHLDAETEVVGKVSMDNLALNRNDAQVCVLADAHVWARRFGTITYEVLAKLSPRIPREIV